MPLPWKNRATRDFPGAGFCDHEKNKAVTRKRDLPERK
jgi:hypothetical protein